MRSIQFPEMRQEVILALASLADSERQGANWFSEITPNGYHHVIHVLYDDMAGFPRPAQRVSAVFREGPEIDRLQALSDALTDLLDGPVGAEISSIHLDDRWNAIRVLAGRALAAMVLSDR